MAWCPDCGEDRPIVRQTFEDNCPICDRGVSALTVNVEHHPACRGAVIGALNVCTYCNAALFAKARTSREYNVLETAEQTMYTKTSGKPPLRRRDHVYNMIASAFTYGTWLPFYWLIAKRKISVRQGVYTFAVCFALLLAAIPWLDRHNEARHQENVLALSDQDRSVYQALSNDYSWLEKADRLELATLPEALRKSYLSEKTQERATEAHERATEAKEEERRRNSPLNKWYSCKFQVGQTIAGWDEAKRVVASVCGRKPTE